MAEDINANDTASKDQTTPHKDRTEVPETAQTTKVDAITTPEYSPNNHQAVKARRRKNFPRILKPSEIMHNIRNRQIGPIIIYGLLLLFIAATVVPVSRYKIIGTLISKPYEITIIDKDTKKPVSEVRITIDGESARTDKEGKAILSKVHVGSHVAKIEKENYMAVEQSIFVPLLQQKSIPSIALQATGRQVTVSVIDFVTKKPVANAYLKFDSFEARTNDEGTATLVAPVGRDVIEIDVSLDGYNSRVAEVKIQESESVIPENTFTLSKTGKVYFLSKLTGKIDVVKSNIDGSAREVVLEGTGYETEFGTVLIASRDWKHIAVTSNRSADGKQSISYINTSTNEVVTADEGDATFQLTGWYDDRLIYIVTRYVTNEAERYKLKSYNPATGKIGLLDISEFKSLGYSCDTYGYCSDKYLEETIQYAAIIDGGVIYAKQQFGGPGDTTKLYRIRANGDDKKEVGSVRENSYLQQFLAWNPVEVYYSYYENNDAVNKYFELDFSMDAPEEITDPIEKTAIDSGLYKAFLLSPDSRSAFWTESRDGKNVFFTGDKVGDDPKELMRLGDFAAYGWFTDNYLLLTKNSSELYIMPVSGGELSKITDYHKPENGYRPYGYGYGG